ncbi:MAG: MATE family efflux transporter [Clostridia bacterium]|nr:MATE family efflux transporter [Clostridia bacterium]
MNNEKDRVRREQILNGNLLRVIVSICAPIFLYNLFNAFYSVIDAVVVARIDPTSVSAVAMLSQIQHLLSSLGAGVAAGGGIIVARFFGAGDMDDARFHSNQIISLSTVIVAILLAVCLPFANPIMRLSGVPDELIKIGTGYFIVQVLTLAFMFYNSVFMAMQKAKGNTKIMLWLNILVMIIKLSLSLLFIWGMNKKDIVWVAVATMIGQSVMFVILLLMMLDKNNIFTVKFNEFKLNLNVCKKIFAISFPIFLGKFIFSFGKVSINGMCKEYGPLVVGALGVSNNVNGLATTPINSFEEGTSTIISQNLGAGNQRRALQTFKYSFIMATALGVIGYVIIRFLLQDQIIGMYNQNEVADGAAEFLALIKSIHRYDSLSILALAVNSAVLGVLYGYGQTKMTMALNISRVFVFRIPILWYLQTFHKEIGAEAAGISMGISNICIALASLACLGLFLWKINKKKSENQETVSENPQV